MKEIAKGKVGGNKWLTWSEFLKWLEENKGQTAKSLVGTFVITHVYPPNKYPTATVVFWVEELETGVKKAIPPQEWSALSALFPAGKAVKGFQLWISFNEGEYSILQDDAPTAVYTPTQGGGWELV